MLLVASGADVNEPKNRFKKYKAQLFLYYAD